MVNTYLYITPFFPTPDNWRGAYGYDFVKALTRQLELRAGVGEWRVEVFKPGDGRDYEVGGITVRTFKTRQLPSNVLPFMFRKYNEKSFIDKVKSVGEVEGWKIEDIAVCHGNTATFAIYPLSVKRLNAKCKTLLHHHDLASFGLNMGRLRHCWLYNLYMFPVLRKLHEAIDTHVFISEASRKSFRMAPDTSWTIFEDYKRQMRGLPYRPVKIKNSVILHNGVDKSVFREAEGRRPKVEGEFVIGCVGNFDDGKGQVTLLRAVQALKTKVQDKIKVVFVGSGPELEKCKKYASKNGIDAEFRSEVRHENLADFYRSLNLFVLPSYFEGFGCVFTEAYACGVPFVTCEGQGMDDVVSDGEKAEWLCRPMDYNDLADKICNYNKYQNVQNLKAEIDITKTVANFVASVVKLEPGEGVEPPSASNEDAALTLS